MKVHRFSLDHLPLGDELVVTDQKLLHQLQAVLELRVGEVIQVFDPHTERSATIVVTDRQQVVLRLGHTVHPLPQLASELHLAVSLLKGDAWDDMVREVSQLGVKSIQPLICERTIVRQLTTHKRERYGAIAREATELSGGQAIPVIHQPLLFTEWLAMVDPTKAVLLDHSGSPIADHHWPKVLWMAVGPEGGWTPQEFAQATTQGLVVVSLLPRVLTARFAPAAAAATLLSRSASQVS